MILILLRVAYLTLIERHLLGNSQLRTRVSKVSFYGLLQPVLDGIKLLTKSNLHPNNQIFFYNLGP